MSLDTIVNVTIAVEATAPTRPNFGMPLLLAYHTKWNGLTRTYASLEEMVDDGFETDDAAYKMARVLKSQKPHPPRFKVGRRLNAPTQILTLEPTNVTEDFVYTFTVDGVEISYTVGSSATLQVVTEGIQALIDAIPTAAAVVETAGIATWNLDDAMTLFVEVDGVAETVTFNTADFVDINAATAAEVVAAMNADLTGSPASAVANRVRLSSAAEGLNSTIQVTGGTANAVLNFPTTLSRGTSAIESVTENNTVITITMQPGYLIEIDLQDMDPDDLLFADATTDPGLEDDLNAIVNADRDWYALALDSNSPAEVAVAAAWLETQRRIGIFSHSNTEAMDPEVDDDLLSDLMAAEYTRVGMIFSKSKTLDYRAVAWLAEEITKNPGSSTWAFKTLTGITADNLTEAEFAALTGKNCSVYVSYGGQAITYEGHTPAGEYIDIPHFIDWLHSEMQLSVFGVLTSNDKLPYTDRSVELIKNVILAVLIRSTKKPIEGLRADPVPTVTAPLVADVDIADRANRLLPDVEFSGELAGAIHKLVINGKVTV